MAAIDAKRALALAGVPFRPQGRDLSGLDCVGLCLLAYRIPVDQVRDDYRLSNDHKREVMTSLLRWFRRIGKRHVQPGDLLLFAPAQSRMHLAVRTDIGFVHADARLRQVVHRPGVAPWPLVGGYRRRVRR